MRAGSDDCSDIFEALPPVQFDPLEKSFSKPCVTQPERKRGKGGMRERQGGGA
jgi:hypothetical protein